MTRDEVIRLAQESGWTSCAKDIYPPLERFAALVAAHERAACAETAMCFVNGGQEIANAIRARGEK